MFSYLYLIVTRSLLFIFVVHVANHSPAPIFVCDGAVAIDDKFQWVYYMKKTRCVVPLYMEYKNELWSHKFFI